METRKLGRSGLDVSVLSLGTMTLGEASEGSMMHGLGCDEATSFALLDRAVEAGVNLLDTADVYGNDGLSERVIGQWFDASGKRDQVVLATKFRFRMKPGPNGTGASRHRIVRCVEDSLRRLRTDRIDLYQVHMQDVETPEEETLRALDDLVSAGKVVYIGASNCAAWRLVDSLNLADRRGWSRFISLQVQYSLLAREIEREHVGAAVHHGLGILPWSPLAGGFLTGKYSRDAAPDASARYARWKDAWGRLDRDRHWDVLDAVRAVAGELEATPAQVSLAWLLRKPGVSSVVFGARSLAQLDEVLPAATLRLSDDQVRRLDEASAPELGYPYDFMKRVQGRW